MRELSSTAASRGALSEALSDVHHGGQRIVVTRRGKPIAGLVPLADLVRLEQPAAAAPPQQEGT
jgi:prevent-host-death family protein